jgi:sarcosine oxidase subunit beta
LVLHGACSFADITSHNLARFDGLAPDWREQRGWLPLHNGGSE